MIKELASAQSVEKEYRGKGFQQSASVITNWPQTFIPYSFDIGGEVEFQVSGPVCTRFFVMPPLQGRSSNNLTFGFDFTLAKTLY